MCLYPAWVLTGWGGFTRTFLAKSVQLPKGGMERRLKVLHNNPETFRSPSITAELGIWCCSLHYGLHPRSKPGKQWTIAKTKLISRSISASLHFLTSDQITSSDGVTHCSATTAFVDLFETNLPIAPFRRTETCAGMLVILRPFGLRRAHCPEVGENIFSLCGFWRFNSQFSVLLNHYQLPQSASCQVSHPLMCSQLAVTQATARYCWGWLRCRNGRKIKE